ncbi:MAG: SEC-C domain-containing protein [Bryobacteraceae bacterium]
MDTIVPDTLTPAQAQVVTARAQGATITAAAQAAGLHRSTVYHWIENSPDFADAIEQARTEYVATLRDDLHELSRNALATLRSLLDDPGTPRALRFRVAMAILQRPQFPEHDWRLPEPVGEPYREQLRRELDDLELDYRRVRYERACELAADRAAARDNAGDPGSLDHLLNPDIEPLHIPPFDEPSDVSDVSNLSNSAEIAQPSPQLVAAAPKISRNQPCPCGSGRKFKRCCLDKPAASPAPRLRAA